ncbi:hypothetical protein FKM82_006230 [Ascaphus truei]
MVVEHCKIFYCTWESETDQETGSPAALHLYLRLLLSGFNPVRARGAYDALLGLIGHSSAGHCDKVLLFLLSTLWTFPGPFLYTVHSQDPSSILYIPRTLPLYCTFQHPSSILYLPRTLPLYCTFPGPFLYTVLSQDPPIFRRTSFFVCATARCYQCFLGGRMHLLRRCLRVKEIGTGLFLFF